MNSLDGTSDLRLNQLLDAAEDTAIAIAIVDASYRLMWLNRAAERFFHCSNEEVAGQSVRDLHIRNHVAASRFEEAVEQIKAGRSFEYRVEQPGEEGVRHLGMHLCGLWQSSRLVGYLLLARDITERYNSELRVRKEGEHYRNLYEHAPVPYHSLDARGRIRHVNPAWLKALGYEEKEVIGRPIQDFLEEGQAKIFEEAFETFKRKGKLCGLELTMRRSDGRHRIVSLTGCAIYDERNCFHHTHCILLDITEQKSAVRALRESEERFSLFMDNLPAAAFIQDKHGTVLYANQYLKRHFAIPDQGGIVKLPLPFGKGEPAKTHPSRQGTVKVRRNDGDERIFQVYRFVIPRESKPILFGGIAIDITEKERNRRDLELFRFALEKSGDAVYWLTPEAKLLYVNEAACRQLGYTRRELLTKHAWDIDVRMNPSACREVWERLKEEGTLRLESVHRRKDGREFPVEITANHLVCGEEEFNCAVVRDVSEQQRVQKELQQAHKMEALGQLTSGIAHDFNNILASILGFSELSLIHLEAGKMDNLRSHLKEINTAGRRGKELIEQMLRFTRSDSREQKRLLCNPW